MKSKVVLHILCLHHRGECAFSPYGVINVYEVNGQLRLVAGKLSKSDSKSGRLLKRRMLNVLLRLSFY